MTLGYSWYLPIMQSLPQDEVAKIFPYFILPKFGGIVFAPNYVPRVDIYPYLAPDRVNMLESHLPHSESVSSGIVASKADHPLWNIVHERLLRGEVDIGEVIGKHPSMVYYLPCKNFNRISDRVGMLRHTSFTQKCGLEEDPCLYGSMQ
jgi:hypothetical protein